VNRGTGWLIPTVLTAYIALYALGQRDGSMRWLLLCVPTLVFFGWRRLAGTRRFPLLGTARDPFALLLLGTGMYVPTLAGPAGDAMLQAAMAGGLGLVTVAPLLCLAELPSASRLLAAPPASRSTDAAVAAGAVWALACVVSLARALVPSAVLVDPPALDTTFLFAALGGLLLITAGLLRARFLRAAELGVADRTGSALAIAVAGTGIGAGSGFIQAASADTTASLTLLVTASLVVWCLAAPSAAKVAQMTRGGLAVALLGAPTALGGAWLTLALPERAAQLALVLAATSIGVGLVAAWLSRPLGPAGSRWIDAMQTAMVTALHPEPDLALRGALTALRQAERRASQRPELFRHDPPALLSVDVAGYLSITAAEFPSAIHDLASQEPGRTLRREAVLAAQVRRPELRPAAIWFAAHEAKSATALSDGDGPVGLLVLPAGKRRTTLVTEEVMALEALTDRMTGLLSVTSALARANRRQLEAEQQVRTADQHIEGLSAQLSDQTEAGRREAELLAAAVQRTAHGPAAVQALQALEQASVERILYVDVPPGADAIAWAAHVHLARGPAAGPFVVVDCTSPHARSAQWWQERGAAAPFSRARAGTLVLLWAHSLNDDAKTALLEAYRAASLAQLILAGPGAIVHPELDGPHRRVPTLEERAEDLQSLIVFELTRLGLTTRGTPLGISRAALATLLDRAWTGGELELRGILSACAARTSQEIVSLEDLTDALASSRDSASDASSPGQSEPPLRTRARRAPRSRAH
jgi:hypothetical protein